MGNNYAMNSRRGINALFLLTPFLFIFAISVFPFIELAWSKGNINLISEVTGTGTIAILTRQSIYNSLSQGAASAAASLLVGLPLGIFLGRYNFRFKKAVTSMAIVPFFLPSIIVVFAFTAAFGTPRLSIPFLDAGFSGIIAVNTFFNAPLVALFTMTSLQNVDQAYDEAAMTLGSRTRRRFTSIWGRAGITAAAGGSLLSFMYSFAGFAAPLIIGGQKYFTLDAEIYWMVKVLNDMQVAVLLAILEAIILIIPATVYVIAAARSRKVVSTGARYRSYSRNGGPYFTAGVIYASAWIALETYLLFSILYESFLNQGLNTLGIRNYLSLFSSNTSSILGISAGGALLNSLFYGISTAFIVTTIGLIWILGKRRSNGSRPMLADVAQYIPIVISSIMMAFAIYFVFEAITPEDAIWVLIVLAQTTIAIPVVLRVIEAGFSEIPSSLSEASFSLGGHPFLEIEIPLARSTFASSLMFGFAISLGEFNATYFLATSKFLPLTVVVYDLQGRMYGVSYAAAAIILAMSLIAFFLIQKMGEKFVVFR